VIALAERDPLGAQQTANFDIAGTARRDGQDDWPDLLAKDIAAEDVAGISQWAEQHSLARETVARGFAKAYGTPPRRFRFELAARRAWFGIVTTSQHMADMAAELGFSDQAHMSRSVSALTGVSPAAWRRNFTTYRGG
jgi:AraC-like DNA-binding protein